MRYLVSKGEFIRINETSGTIQNASSINTIEVSDSPTNGSGVLIPPFNKHSFKDAILFVQCVDGAGAEVRVVPFNLAAEGGDGELTSLILNGEEYSIATNIEITSLLDSVFGEE